jgi:hypothetical protein
LVANDPFIAGIKQGDKLLIHGINYIDNPDKIDEEIIASINGLIKEYKYYEQCSYSFNHYKSLVNFNKIGGAAEAILKTPLDLDIFMNKFEGSDLLSK